MSKAKVTSIRSTGQAPAASLLPALEIQRYPIDSAEAP